MALDNPLSGETYTLAKPFKKADLTFDVVGRFEKTNAGTFNDIGQQILCFSIGETRSRQERSYINITTNPTLINATTGVYQYTIASVGDRGLDSENTDSTNLLSSADRILNHPAGRKVAIVNSAIYLAETKQIFVGATIQEVVTAGEAIDTTAAPLGVSLHTDGLYYKYDSSTLPNLQGVIEGGQTIAISGTFTLKNLRGTSITHTGLTGDDLMYVDDTGVISSTASSTTKFLGKARNTTIIDHAIDNSGLTKATTIKAQAGTDNADFLTSSTGKDSIDRFAGTFDIFAAEAIAQNEVVKSEIPVPFASATSDIDFGTASPDEEKAEINIIGNGIAGSTLKLALKKFGAPTDNITVRIETDSSGEPSGILADANATGTVAGTGLTTSYVDTTVTLGGSFTLTDDTLYHLVLGRDSSQDDTNYYAVGASTNNTARFFQWQMFDGATWTTDDTRAPYIDFTGLKKEIYVLADASNTETAANEGVCVAAITALATGRAKTDGFVDTFSGLTVGEEYYLSDTAGAVATTPGTINIFIGDAKDETVMKVGKVADNVYLDNSANTDPIVLITPTASGTMATLGDLLSSGSVFFSNVISHNPFAGDDVVAHGLSGTPEVFIAFLQTSDNTAGDFVLASITADATNLTVDWGSVNAVMKYGLLAIKF